MDDFKKKMEETLEQLKSKISSLTDLNKEPIQGVSSDGTICLITDNTWDIVDIKIDPKLLISCGISDECLEINTNHLVNNILEALSDLKQQGANKMNGTISGLSSDKK